MYLAYTERTASFLCYFQGVTFTNTSRSKYIIYFGVKIILTFLCRSHAQTLWEALCACWLPVRIGFRPSAGRRCLQRAAQVRTCSWSPSRSSNVLMTLPRQPSSLSPSLQRRIPTNSTYRATKPSASQFCCYINSIFNGLVVFVFVVYACVVFLCTNKYW